MTRAAVRGQAGTEQRQAPRPALVAITPAQLGTAGRRWGPIPALQAAGGALLHAGQTPPTTPASPRPQGPCGPSAGNRSVPPARRGLPSPGGIAVPGAVALTLRRRLLTPARLGACEEKKLNPTALSGWFWFGCFLGFFSPRLFDLKKIFKIKIHKTMAAGFAKIKINDSCRRKVVVFF